MHNHNHEITIRDIALPEQEKWEDGETYVVVLKIKQLGRDTMYKDEHNGGTTRYEILKATPKGKESDYNRLRDKAKSL